jgi:cysteine desulfurase
MLANNETGVIEPVQQAADLCREKGVLFHTDAVQAVGKLPIGFRELGVDALTFTAHKFHGPRGIGALVVRAGLTLDPQLFGGFQQMGIRPGTEDVAMVVGMARALEIVCGDQYQSSARMEQLRNQLQSSIAGQVPDVVISGTDGPLPTSRFSALGRVPHTLNISFPGLNRQEFLMAADMRGLAISTGSACASGSSEQSHVLIAMGAAEAVIDGSIRISLGIDTTESQIDEATRRIIKLVKDLRRQNKD